MIIVTVFWALIFLVSSFDHVKSCGSEEWRALMDFKASLNEIQYPDLILPSWSIHHLDCCKWEGVLCSRNDTVVELQLHDLARDIHDDFYFPNWFLNFTTFLPLNNLESLDLRRNFLGITGLACERLSDLKTLKSLNLDNNNFNNTILHCVAAISSLKNLSLAGNYLEGLFPLEEINVLKQLEHLDLSNNQLSDCDGLADLKNLRSINLDFNKFNDSIPQCVTSISSLRRLSLASNHLRGLFPLQDINKLNQLEHLDLSFNAFSVSLSFKGLTLKNLTFLNLNHTNISYISSLEVLNSLEFLSLANNFINDSSILQGICSMKNLVELHLGGNEFSGNIPLCFSNLTSLKALDISHNGFGGKIPPIIISTLIHLEYLSLQANHFEGSFSLGILSNHTDLRVLSLGRSGGGLFVDTKDLVLPPPFQLRVVYLPNCNLLEIPNFLFYQKEVRVLDLSSNNLIGEIPNWLLENNTQLQSLNLRNNSFRGQILSRSLPKMEKLLILDLSNNKVGGQILRDTGLLFPSLVYLNLSRNGFQGSIPESIGYLKEVHTIDLSHNNLSGEVPTKIGIECILLSYLYLSNNGLQGHFPLSSMNLSFLEVLHLENNNFSGVISDGLSHSYELTHLDMSNNHFEGQIPSWIGNLISLETLVLSENQLQGTIPNDICNLVNVWFLDLSENQFNGSIPPCSTLSSLRFIHLQRNQITGSIPNALLEGSKDMVTIDFRHNHLSGGIPRDITTFLQLRVLLLGGNDLHGHIPEYICNPKYLTILDLSQNNFSGQIPSCLGNISFGANFSLFDGEWHYGLGDIFYMPMIEYGIPFALGLLTWNVSDDFSPSKVQEIVEFRTKNRINNYAGDVLYYMSGLDLSCNQLVGEIPKDFGDVNGIRALNLSQNNLQGGIPSKLSKLTLLESLDLSYNHFSGQIPMELTDLHFLSYFNVSYNNLSGTAPENGQFGNFDEDNYKGNPYLCGHLLKRHCKRITDTTDLQHGTAGQEEDNGGLDIVAFLTCFFVSFVIALATLGICLYLSPQYRRTWFDLIDRWILWRFYLWYYHYQPRSK